MADFVQSITHCSGVITCIDVGMRKFPQDVVIEVEFHLTREFRARRWVAIQLLRLAAWVLGCGIEVGADGDPE